MSKDRVDHYAKIIALLTEAIATRRELIDVGYQFTTPPRWEERLRDAIEVLEYFKDQATGLR
jgi:hypothetical protein